MPNLSKAVTKVSTINGLEDLRTLQRNLMDFDTSTTKDVKTLMKYDADNLLVQLLTGYYDYIERYVSSDDQSSSPSPVGYVLDKKDGYTVSIYGKNLWYYEFGTGDTGAKSKHSEKLRERVGYQYNAGPTVIHANTYDPNSNDYDGSLPSAYINVVNKHPEMAAHNWWVHKSDKGPLSNGIPAGNILYGAVRDMRKDNLFASSGSTNKLGVTPNNLTNVIKNNLLKGLK